MAKKSRPRKRPEGLPAVKDICEIIPKSNERVQYKCGHEGWKKFHVSFWGEKMAPAAKFIEERNKCPDCMLQEALRDMIRCALCGLSISPGDPVALYLDDGSFKKEWSTRHGVSVIGCLRWNCCPSDGFFAGNWDGKKLIPAFEHEGAVAQARATGKLVAAKVT
jgi:hypothetical protein